MIVMGGRRVRHQHETWNQGTNGWNSPSATTVYIYDAAGNLAAEYGDSTTTSECIICYLTTDPLGSTRLLTDENGVAKARFDYLPFGQEILPPPSGDRADVLGYGASNAIRHKFTAKERDAETGLDYFGARYDSSAQGRFTSPDPLMASATVFDPQTWNRYSFARNNPLRFIDPTGMAEVSAEECQKDQRRCVNVKVNVIYDRNANGGEGLTDKQKEKFEKTLLNNAKDQYGNSKVRLDVSYSPGSFERTAEGANIEGTVKGAVNIVVSDSNVGLGGGVSFESNGNAYSLININQADAHTLNDELAHQFMGDPVGVWNFLSRHDPTQVIVNPVANTLMDFRNDYELFRQSHFEAFRITSYMGVPMRLAAPFNEGARRFQAPITQEAIRPRQ